MQKKNLKKAFLQKNTHYQLNELITLQAYEERVNTLVAVADELVRENYHDAERIQNGKNKIIQLWNMLLVLLKQRRARLEKCMRLQRVFQEMINIIDWMDEMKVVYCLFSIVGLVSYKLIFLDWIVIRRLW